MEEKGFLKDSEAVVADSDLLKKKLDAMRGSGPHKLQVWLMVSLNKCLYESHFVMTMIYGDNSRNSCSGYC